MSSVDRLAYAYALAPGGVVLVVGPALALLLPSPVALSLGLAWYLGVGPILAGVGLALWAVHAFARAGASPSPVDRPDRLVTDGPLAYTRNPFYLGIVTAAIGEGILFESVVVAAYAGLLWVAYHLLLVGYEEPKLRDALGAEYERYCERVPRWVGRVDDEPGDFSGS